MRDRDWGFMYDLDDCPFCRLKKGKHVFMYRKYKFCYCKGRNTDIK